MDLLKETRLKIFVIGICGVGVSSIARYLSAIGFSVSGSDNSCGFVKEILLNEGITVFDKHDASNVVGADVVIYSSAINRDNPELDYAIRNKIPIYSRAEVLSMIEKKFPISLCVCGAHGKTTTTALIATVLKNAKVPFTAFIGGFDNDLTNYFRSGDGVFLAEICEYKRNIELFGANIGVITNVDNDHLDCYNDLEDLIGTFAAFSKRADRCIVNAEDDNCKGFSSVKSFGIDKGDFTAEKVETDTVERSMTITIDHSGKEFLKVKVGLFGKHNVYNVLAAVAALNELNINKSAIALGLSRFKGVRRRNEYLGVLFGAKVFADYAHHPSEIECFLDNYDIGSDRVHVVFQPHTFSRTKILFNDFIISLKKVRNLYIYKTFASRETYDREGSAEKLAENIGNCGYFEDIDSLMTALKCRIKSGDILLIVGAGDVYDKLSLLIKKARN